LRLGAGEWLSRRDAGTADDEEAGPVRPGLHPALVAVAGPEDHRADRFPRHRAEERVLMGTSASVPAPAWPPAAVAVRRHAWWRDRAIEMVLVLGIGSSFLMALVNANVSAVSPAMTYAL